jgi:heterodisulfide reductase subunit B
MVYQCTVRPVTLVEFLFDHKDFIAERVTQKLSDLKVACYYGCLHTRPPDAMGFDDTEQPTTMDEVCRVFGLDPVDWSHKTECCGAGFTMSRPGIVARLTGRILRAASEAGADAVVAACPMCHANLDMRQGEAAEDAGLGPDFHMPIFYLSQMLGLAMDLEPKALSLGTHFVDVSAMVARLRGEAPQAETADEDAQQEAAAAT